MPMWDGPDPGTIEARILGSAPDPVESFAFAPPWLAAAWAARGAAGYWATDPPQVRSPCVAAGP